jgi:hypothetical protein
MVALGRRHRQLILVTIVLVVFVALLAIWVGNPNKGHQTIIGAPPSSPGTTLSITDSPTASPTATPSPSGTGVGDLKLPPVSGIQYYGPGVHTVVLTVTSDSTIAAVGWVFRNGKDGKKYAVGKNFSLTEQVEGGAPLAIVAAQVAYYGTEATCAISVDGHQRTTATAHGAFHVVVCIA